MSDLNKNEVADCKYLAYLLRHHPEDKNLILDDDGYTDVSKLLEELDFSKEYLEKLVSNETRFGFNEDKSKIKAFHGHTVSAIQYTNIAKPPVILYHGTSEENLAKIISCGYIKSMERNLVHLSDTKEKALNIGGRHGIPIVLEIDCLSMISDGYIFYKSEDGVYLTKDFSLKYVKNIP